MSEELALKVEDNSESKSVEPLIHLGADEIADRDDRGTVGEPMVDDPRIRVRNVDVYYDDKQAINDVSLDIGKNEVLAMIGPSGCGKSTFLRCLNRMNDTIPSCRVTGEILFDGQQRVTVTFGTDRIDGKFHVGIRRPVVFRIARHSCGPVFGRARRSAEAGSLATSQYQQQGDDACKRSSFPCRMSQRTSHIFLTQNGFPAR